MAPSETASDLKQSMLVEMCRRVGEVRFRAEGTSMLPAIRPGDLVIVRKCEGTDIGPGQIGVFSRDGRLFAHRVLRHELRTGTPILITRGDRQWRPDPPFAANELIGEVTGMERNGALLKPSERGVGARVLRLVSLVSDLPAGVLVWWHRRRERALPHPADPRRLPV